MTGLRLLRAASVEPTGWRNGGGTTRRLLTSREHATGDANRPHWTLSLADLTGPAAFSTFAGMDRTLLFLGDGALDLRVDGELHAIGSRHQLSFPGEATVELVAGRGLALNLMTLRGVVDGHLVCSTVPGQPPPSRSAAGDEALALVVLEEGEGFAPGDTVLLAAGDVEVHEGLTDVPGETDDLPVDVAFVHLRPVAGWRVDVEPAIAMVLQTP